VRVLTAAVPLMASTGTAIAATKAAPPPALQGRVTAVADGSTLTIEVAGQPALRVKLRDIEIPEPCQPGHAESRQALADFALHKPALVQPGRLDAQGRAVSVVKVDEADLSQRMVEEGYAWSVRSRWDRGPLVKQERMAQTLRRGLHASGTLSPADAKP
jgi:endonuclease YncB( thermonuclease family)